MLAVFRAVPALAPQLLGAPTSARATVDADGTAVVCLSFPGELAALRANMQESPLIACLRANLANLLALDGFWRACGRDFAWREQWRAWPGAGETR